MILKKNSWYYKLYVISYGEKVPDNLCSFFWRLMYAIILFIPLFILQLPVRIMNKLSKDKNNPLFSKEIFIGIVMYIFLFTISSLILVPFDFMRAWKLEHAKTFYELMLGVGLSIWVILILFILPLVLIALGIKRYINGPSNKPSLTSEFIKVKKNKYCPKIEWE